MYFGGNDIRFHLGSVYISAKPIKQWSKLQKAHVAAGRLVEPGEDTTEMRDLVDITLDQMVFTIQLHNQSPA